MNSTGFLRGLAALTLAVGCSGVTVAQDTATLPKAEDLIDKAIGTMGGQEAFDKVKTLETVATIEMQTGMMIELTVYSGPDGKFRVKQGTPIGDVELGCDGETGWMKNPMSGEYQVMDERTLAESRRQAGMHYLLLDHEDKYESIETVGREMFADTEAYKIQMTDANGAMFAYVDADKGMPLGIERRQGPNVIVATFKDWKEADGLNLFRTVELDQMGMKIAMIFDKVEVNKLDMSVFELPAEVALMVAEAADEAEAEEDKGGEGDGGG